ncbi:MAG: sigma factor, partial [Aureliella sp.]
MLQFSPLADQSDEPDTRHLTLRTLFESEETPLLRYAFSLVGRRAVAEEIVQEVFLLLHEHWDDVDCPQAWLMRSVRNKAYNH